MKIRTESSSFRDPSGVVFYDANGLVHRGINKSYLPVFNMFIKSGLYENLVKQELIVAHQEVNKYNKVFSKVIKPDIVPLISYPYEWSFSQLKDAALTTLKIQKISIEHGLSLKDASAYNIQFFGYKPKLIDTLSFEKYNEVLPWVAYKQFCQHFLAPLTLMSKKGLEFSKLSRLYIDGIPLSLTVNILGLKSFANWSTFSHIFLHSKSQERYSDKGISVKSSRLKFSKVQMLSLLESLENAIRKLSFPMSKTEWGEYYSFTNYSDKSFTKKKKIVKEMVSGLSLNQVWDLGANNGEFSRVVFGDTNYVLSADIDPVAVEKNYLLSKENKESELLPVVFDLVNPSPSIGWLNKERMSLMDRKKKGVMVMALALIHHLAISNNLPFVKIAEYFSSLGKYLIVEFVPKDDSKVKILLSSREDIFVNYNETSFVEDFSKYYTILKKVLVPGSKRVLYRMTRRTSIQ